MSNKSRFFSALQLLFLCLLTFSILRAPASACSYGALALQLWFEKMIPSLFPFMVLSGMIVRLNLGKTIALPAYPLFGRLYLISKTMCTTLLTGFLFGFPLGAKTIAEQYSLGQLSREQAQYLLSFCNNIGPVYLLSFALPLLGLSGDTEDQPLRIAVILAFFGIPLTYGLVLRHTVYRSMAFSTESSPASTRAGFPRSKAASAKTAGTVSPAPASFKDRTSAPLSAASSRKHRAIIPLPAPSRRIPGTVASSAAIPTSGTTSLAGQCNVPAALSFIPALDASVTSACAAITRLGGYMVFFMVCNLLFEKTPFAVFLAPVLEITSGLTLAKDALSPALFMTMLTFGGLSCFAQTYTCIRDTDLSFGNYCLHKLLQSATAFFLYTLLFSAAF